MPQDILRSDVHWSVHVDLGEFVPGYFETKAEEFVAAAMNPSQFGGTPTSDSSFVIDKPLLPIEFSGARLSYDSALASSAGMTLGGAVTLPLDVGHDTVQVIARSFGPAKMLVLCSQSHGAPKDLQARFVTTTGEASFNFAGALCGCEFLAPNDGLDQYATGTATNVGGTQDIWVRLNGAVALGVKEPVRIVVRTARGVRLVDLGVPAHVTINSDGFVENVEITYYDDCIYLRKPPFDNRADWFARFINRLIDPEPIEWTSFAERGAGLSVQLVNLTGLEPGELVQFRSPTHAIDVTANRHGAVTLPAMMRLRGPPQPAFMIRVNQQSIAGHVVSRAALFERRATLRAGRATRLAEFDKGMALVSAEFGNRVETHLIGDLGVFTRVERDHPRVALAPCESAFSCDLPGLVSLLRVPGFGDAPIAIAVMADDTKLIVEQDGDGFRVAGAFVGPIGAMTELGEWATLTSGQQVFVYAVTRAAEKRPAMHEDEPASNGPKEHPCDCG